MQKLRILIVDDHQMIRDGIRTMLEIHTKKYRFLIDEASTGEEGIEKARTGKFDLIIMDYRLPKFSGAEATKTILRNNPMMKVLALSNFDESAYITEMMRAGAKGFILKDIGPEELIKAIETILDGKLYFCNDAALHFIKVEESKPQYLTPKILTAREAEVLALIANEHTNEEIAKKLFISKRTVDKFRQILLEKLNVKNTAGLVKKAIELKLVN